MKKKIKKTVIICLLVSIYFFVISCDFDDGDYDNGFGNGIFGKNLKLSGQVYQKMQDGKYEKWNSSDDAEIHPQLGGSGVLEQNGKFSFTIDTPNKYAPHFEWGTIYYGMKKLNNFKISPDSVQMARLNSLTVDFNSDFYIGILENIPRTSSRDILEYVYFIYVDQDVTVSADKTNYTEQIIFGTIGNPSTVMDINYSTNAFNHNLKAGWNAVFVRTIFEDNNTNQTFLHTYPSNWMWTLGFITIPPFPN